MGESKAKRVLTELGEKNPKARTVTPDAAADSRFITELDESGFIDRLYR